MPAVRTVLSRSAILWSGFAEAVRNAPDDYRGDDPAIAVIIVYVERQRWSRKGRRRVPPQAGMNHA